MAGAAGLPASPPFANPAANALPEFHTPAAIAVTFNTVRAAASRKRRLHQTVDDGITSGGIPLITPAEAGMADVRHASAIAQSFGAAVAPPWFAGALAAGLAPIQAQLAPIQAQIAPMAIQLASLQAQVANVTITRNNVQASKEGDLVEFEKRIYFEIKVSLHLHFSKVIFLVTGVQ